MPRPGIELVNTSFAVRFTKPLLVIQSYQTISESNLINCPSAAGLVEEKAYKLLKLYPCRVVMNL